MILKDGNYIYLIFYFLYIFQKFILNFFVDLPFNTTFDFKFSCSTGDELNLVYHKNSNNCVLIN